MIITATLKAVASVASLIMNRENEDLPLDVMRLAMNRGKFNANGRLGRCAGKCKGIRPNPQFYLHRPIGCLGCRAIGYLRRMVISLTIVIIVVTAIVTFLAFSNPRLLNALLLWPAIMDRPKEYYRFLTAGFVHADYVHLAFNMFTLYFFGELLEGALGPARFLALYLLGIIVSCVPSYLKKRKDPRYRSLGASGGVAAIVFAFIYLSPWSKLYIFFAIGLPSIVFAVLYLAYTAYLARKGSGIVNHDAHLWGSVFGFLFMLVVDPSHGQFFIRQLMSPSF